MTTPTCPGCGGALASIGGHEYTCKRCEVDREAPAYIFRVARGVVTQQWVGDCWVPVERSATP